MVEQQIAYSTADPRDGASKDRRRNQSEHAPQGVQSEWQTEVSFNQTRDEHGFECIARGEYDGTRDVAVAKEIGRDGCSHDPDDDRQPCRGPKPDYHARRDTRSWPENGNAIRFCEQGKAQPCRREIRDADRNRERYGNNPGRQEFGNRRRALTDLSAANFVA